MGFRTLLRSLMSRYFSSVSHSNFDVKTERGQQKTRNHPHATRPHHGCGYNDAGHKSRTHSHKDHHASGGQKHRLSESLKPLPVVPRQRPPQQGQQYPSKAPLHIQSHNVQHQQQLATDAGKERNEILWRQRKGSNQAIFFSDDRSMNREAVCEVIDMIALRFSHIPYAVSGLAAMAYYGYDARPYKVSIVCPEHTRENQKCWAKAQGMIPIPRRHDIWGVATSDGVIRQIRVRFPYDFAEMHALKIGNSAVSMLSLAGLADELARTYVNELKHSDHNRQENLAREMIWVLKRIIQCRLPEHMLRPERIPHLTKETFWLPFTLSYPDSVPLFAKAGWRIPNEGWS